MTVCCELSTWSRASAVRLTILQLQFSIDISVMLSMRLQENLIEQNKS